MNSLILLNTGSPAVFGDKEEDVDVDVDENTADFPLTESQADKQKIAQRMLSWHMTYGRGEDTNAPAYDKEIPRNHIPSLTSAQEVGCFIYLCSILSFTILFIFNPNI